MELEQARALDEERVAASPNNAVAKLDLSFDLSELSQAYQDEKQPRKALVYVQQVLAIRQALVDADPKNARVKGRLAFALLRAGQLQSELKEYSSAIASLRSSITINETLENDPEALSEAARAYLDLGDAEWQTAGRQRGVGSLRTACGWYHKAAKQYTEIKQRSLASSDDLQDSTDAGKKAASCDRTLRR